MYILAANGHIYPNSPFYTAVYHRYSLKSFQICRSAQTLWYQAHFKEGLTGFQVDPSCLTIDKAKDKEDKDKEGKDKDVDKDKERKIKIR